MWLQVAYLLHCLKDVIHSSLRISSQLAGGLRQRCICGRQIIQGRKVGRDVWQLA